MGKSSPDVPAAPDNEALIKESARVNRVDTQTPWGSLTYSGPDKTTATVNLSDAQSGLLGGQQAIQGQMLSAGQNLAGQLPQDALNFDNLPGQVSGLDTSGLTQLVGGDDVAGALYERSASMMRPEFDRAQTNLNTDLANRGLPITSDAYQKSQTRLNTSQNDAWSRLGMDATIAGADRAAANRNTQYGELANNATLQNQARGQGIAERTALRASPYNELAAIMGGTAVQQPQFPGTSPIDTMGAAAANYGGQLNQYNAAQQQNASMLNGLFGLGSLGLSFL